MKKLLFWIGACLIVCVVFVALSTQAFAATTYTPVAGTSTTFNKYLIMDAGDTVPNVTFSFTVAPGAAISADTDSNTVMQVLPGVGTPTIADVVFAPADTTATSAGSNIDVARSAADRLTGKTAANGVELESGEKYATKQATVSFSGITFDEPGIYRYIITETANATHEAAGIMHDNDIDRVLDVYVTDNGSGTLVVSSYVMHKGAGEAGAWINNPDVSIGNDMGSNDVATAGAAVSDKTDGFTNEYNSKDLRFAKSVTGNQASRDKYFEFTVTIPDLTTTDVFAVSITADSDNNTTDGNADATSGTNSATISANQSKTNPSTVTGAQLAAGQKFYLQHGQNIVIRGLPLNASYTVTEHAEDYKSTVMDGKTNSGVISTVAGSGKVAEAGFLNTRAGIVPTGVLLAMLPYVVLLGVGIIAVIAAVALRRRKAGNRQ